MQTISTSFVQDQRHATKSARFVPVQPSQLALVLAKAIVASGPQPTPRHITSARSYGRPRGRWTGCSCGSIDGQPRKSDCWQCRHDSE